MKTHLILADMGGATFITLMMLVLAVASAITLILGGRQLLLRKGEGKWRPAKIHGFVLVTMGLIIVGLLAKFL